MFTGEFNTYLDVRTFVEATFGPLDDDSEVQFLVFLGNALRQMWADLRNDPWYRDTQTITAVDGEIVLPPTLGRICSAVGTITTLDADEDPPDTNTDPTIDLYEYELHYETCSSASLSSSCVSSGMTRAILTASTLVADPVPDSVEIVGYRIPSTSFITVDEGDPDCLVWADIDLPEMYRSPFAKAVLGMMFFGAGDAPRGADWMNFANSEFISLQKANRRHLPHSTAAEMGIYQIGTRKILAPASCGCEVAQNWMLSL